MATAHPISAENGSVAPTASNWKADVDRWIYVFTAGLMFTLVLIGFVPDSMRRIAAVNAGELPPFPPILHVHAVLMGSWITLLLIQSTLMATGRRNWHMQTGIAGLFLLPSMVIAGFLLVPVRRSQLAEMIANAPANVAAQLQSDLVPVVNNIMLLQIRAGILFAILASLGLWFRKRDSGMHKRLMFLATLVPMPAALDRMEFLPQSMPEGTMTVELYPLAVIAPMFIWDLFRLGRIHKAYWIWIALTVPAALLTDRLWSSPEWFSIAARVGGLG
ncbi:hypothetical protein [Qipengyuania soli]|uniref:DUF2306 domain-containing protein n=1 Tax=Qipengyuania soli TaxID=2782568 RepID=A0A7S8F2Y6_9SPHN|nr:hypothetical protein [Qipengyuania soli]QPC98184.1 hypothetical protein IRL76_09935 [Qipengyuania soli]